MKKEQEIQREIMSYLHLQGFLVTRINSISKYYVKSYNVFRFGSVGFPDLIAMKNNQFYLFEVKSEKGKLSENQNKFQMFASMRNVIVYVVRSVSDVKNILESTKL